MRTPTTPQELRVDREMLLPAGKTCADCWHQKRCTMLFGVTLTNTWCDWAPSRFVQHRAHRTVEGGEGI